MHIPENEILPVKLPTVRMECKESTEVADDVVYQARPLWSNFTQHKTNTNNSVLKRRLITKTPKQTHTNRFYNCHKVTSMAHKYKRAPASSTARKRMWYAWISRLSGRSSVKWPKQPKKVICVHVQILAIILK